MKGLKIVVANLANRINQPHYLEQELKKVLDAGIKSDIAKDYWFKQFQEDKWISVKDKLPEKDKKVLAKEFDLLGDDEYVIARWTGEEWYAPFKDRKVTHWQPLPIPPKNL